MGAVRFQPIQPVGGAYVCKLLLQGKGGPFSPEGGEGGGGGGPWPPPPPPGTPMIMEIIDN